MLSSGLQHEQSPRLVLVSRISKAHHLFLFFALTRAPSSAMYIVFEASD
jgi:hypothetical protein